MTTSLNLLTLSCWLAVGASACTDTRVVPEDYSRACTQNSDCAYASFGDACAGCMAELVPINVDDVDDVAADADALRETCAPWSQRYTVDCVVALPSVRPVCDEGTCADGPPDGAPCDPQATDVLCRGSDE